MSKFSFDPKQLEDIFAKQADTPHGKSVLKDALRNKNNPDGDFGYNCLHYQFLKNDYYGSPHYVISVGRHWNEGGVQHGDGWHQGPPDYSYEYRFHSVIPEAEIADHSKLVTNAILSEAAFSGERRDIAFVKPVFKKAYNKYEYGLFNQSHLIALKGEKIDMTRLKGQDDIQKELQKNITSFIQASNAFQTDFDSLINQYGYKAGLRQRY